MTGRGQEIWRFASAFGRARCRNGIIGVGKKLYSTAPISARITQALAEDRPYQAFDVLSDYSRSGGNIPSKYMLELFKKVKPLHDPLLVQLFVDMIPFVAVKSRSRLINAAVELYISVADLETALTFVRNVQVANLGTFKFYYDILESIILAAKYQKDPEIAFQAMQMLASNTNNMVYARTWGLFASVILEAKHYESLKWFVKTAAIPGSIVLDDNSYMAMAAAAAENGDPTMCRWAALRMRRRQRALNIISSAEDLLKVFVCLVEASAGKGEYKAACRYIVRLSDSTSTLRSSQFPNLVRLLSTDDAAFEYYIGIFQEMTADPLANEAVKTLLFNLLLHSRIQTTHYQQGLTIYQHARDAAVVLNNYSRMLLVELGTALWDVSLVESMRCGDARVDKAVNSAIETLTNSQAS